MLSLQLQLLGHFRLLYNDEPLTGVTQARLQSLLAYLALHRNIPLSRQHLAFLFWPDSSEAQAHTNLRQLLHLLRSAWPAVGWSVVVGQVPPGLRRRWSAAVPGSLAVSS